jgi:addiction module HigA family antidote
MTRPIRDRNRAPTHPGVLLREDVFPALGMSQTDFAAELRVSRLTVSQVLHGHRALSAQMAVRLEQRFGINAQQMMAMQTALDLWKARKELARADTHALQLLALSAPYTPENDSFAEPIVRETTDTHITVARADTREASFTIGVVR